MTFFGMYIFIDQLCIPAVLLHSHHIVRLSINIRERERERGREGGREFIYLKCPFFGQ
jgi:hypothetical protein